MKRVILIALGALLLVIAGGAAWVLGTQRGLRFAVARAEGFLAPKLHVQSVEGSVSRTVILRGLRWQDPDGGVDATLDDGQIEIGVGALLIGRVHVRRADLQGLRVQLSPGVEKPDEPSTRAPLDPPVPLRIDDFRLRDARIANADGELVHVRDAGFAAAWTAAALVLDRFDLQADQGEAHFKGTVAVRFGPANSSSTGTSRSPDRLAISTRASSATSTGSVSPAGDAVARFPPTVPALRICGEPTVRAAAASAGEWRATPASSNSV